MSELLTDCGGTIGTDGQVCVCLCISVYICPKHKFQSRLCMYICLTVGHPVCVHLCASLSVCSVYLLPSELEARSDRTAPYLFACDLRLIHCMFVCVCVFADSMPHHVIDRF